MMNKRQRQTAIMLLVVLSILTSGYWHVRYSGWHDEGDAVRLEQAAKGIISEQTLLPSGYIYANGFGFQALLAILGLVTGQEIETVRDLTIFWLPVVVLAGFIAYRRMLQSTWLAFLGAALLLLMPDFLFPVLRASHERITWTFSTLILALWLSTQNNKTAPHRTATILATYLLLCGVIATNVYMASTLLATFLFALLFLSLLGLIRWQKDLSIQFGRRMIYIVFSGLILIFIFTFYLYPPARNYYFALENVADRLAILLLGVEESVPPSSVEFVRSGWRSTPIYLVLVAFQYFILLISVVAWAYRVKHFLVDKEDKEAPKALFLWLLYFGIGVQLAIAGVADFSGAFASNFQVRLMPAFIILAIPMAIAGLPKLQSIPLLVRWQKPIIFAAIPLIGLIAVAALFKVTNDPTVANFWTFYSPQEIRTGYWIEENLSSRNVWIDTSPHKRDILYAQYDSSWQPSNQYEIGPINDRVSHFVISELTSEKAKRYRFALPTLETKNRIYDVGEAQVFHRPPTTPFQR